MYHQIIATLFIIICNYHLCIHRVSEEGIPPHLQPSAHCDHSKHLLEMLNMCFKQFKAIVSSHSHLLDLLESSRKGYGGECHSHTMQYIVFSCSCTESYELYTERDVWACIQQVVGIGVSAFFTILLPFFLSYEAYWRYILL